MPPAVCRARWVVTLALLVGLLTPSPATARTSDATTRQLEQRRREITARKAQAAGQVNVLRASEQKVVKALDDLRRGVQSQEAVVGAARQAAAASAVRAASLKANESRTAARRDDLRSELKGIAVHAYMRGPTGTAGLAFDAADLTEAARRQQLLKTVVNSQLDVTDELRATEEDLGVLRVAAEAATEVARLRKAGEEKELRGLESSVATQQRVAADVEDRLDRQLAEADALETLDGAVAGQIRARQAALARALAARPTTASRRGATSSGAVGGLATVRGITVASSLAGPLAALLDAADASGFSLSGGGYRDSSGQVAARRNNCGSSNYDIYQKPASQCRPPTARPGSSMHEQGLAIDFTSGGSLITSRSNPAFRWLAANAGRFGLSNLPAEPWHWSTNGN